MRRLVAVLFVTLLAFVAGMPAAVAGSPHFIDSAFAINRDGNTLTVTGKEAGLGDEAQIHVVLEATGLCINGGGKHPKAVNKSSFTAQGDFPVQNGKADFSLSVEAVFSPNCSPPMTVAFTDVKVTDTTNNLVRSFPGTF